MLFSAGIRTILVTCGLALAAASLPGQTTAGDGVLEARLVEIAGACTDHGGSQLEYGGGISAQVPLNRHLTASVGYGHSDWNQSEWFFSSHTIRDTVGCSLIVFDRMQKLTPFFGGSVRRDWLKWDYEFGGERIFNVSGHSDSWSAFAGIEVPWHGVVITPVVQYSDGFDQVEGMTSVVLHYGVEVHKWFTRRVGAFAAFQRTSPREPYIVPVSNYAIGLRYRL